MIRSEVDQIGSNDLFTAAKAYSTTKGIFGGLIAPSAYMFDLLCSCEKIFNAQFDELKCQFDVKRRLVDNMLEQDNSRTDQLSKPCSVSIKLAIDLYTRMRLHYKLKFLNRSLRQQKKQNRKAKKILHV